MRLRKLLAMLLALACVVLACDDDPLDDDVSDDDDDSAGEGPDDDDDDADPCDPDHDHVDEAVLAGALEWIQDNPAFFDSMLVQHCGERYVEQYFNGFDAATPHELQSATKTFSATLIGIAIDQGLVDGVDQPLTELLPDHAHLLTGDKALITVEHLLTMTSGLRWIDFGVGNSFDRIAAAEDSVAFILAEPLETTPGEVFHYNTGSSHLLSAILHDRSGMTTAQYAEQHLFGPLDITDVEWPALADGIHQGGWGMYMKPPDFLKFGQLLLDEGTWEGQRIVSADYVDAMTASQVPNGMGGGYGYQMWVETNLFDVTDIAGARGYGGQDCLVLDELEMVVVFTGDIMHPTEMATDVVTLMNEHVIPSHVGPLHDSEPAPCEFPDLSAGRILVTERYTYDPYGDWSWEGAIDAWIWPRPWSRNHGVGVFHWIEDEQGARRLLGLDPAGCGEPCGPGELCAASGACEPVWLDGAAAGSLTVGAPGGTWELAPDGSGYFTGHYTEAGLPAELFSAGDPVTAALSGDDFPAVAGLSATGVASVDTDLAGTWLPLADDQDTLITWTPGPDPAACVEVVINSHNSGHGLPLDAVIHCVGPDSGSLAIPAALTQAFPPGEWLGGFDGTACEGMDCLPSELSRFNRHVVQAEPGDVELVVRSTTYFAWSH